jgi:ADP-ribose pyrophosphatase YjhB (NUDIX family)
MWVDGRLILASHTRGGCPQLSLPGGHVKRDESVIDALVRNVAEETGIPVMPCQLLYVAEVVNSIRPHDLEMIFLARPNGTPSLNGFRAIDLLGGERPEVRPPILEVIARDTASGYRETPRWLGNLWRPMQNDEETHRLGVASSRPATIGGEPVTVSPGSRSTS